MTPEQAREAYKAKRAKGNTRLVRRLVAAKQAKADQRARQFIERRLAGETLQAIADDVGVTKASIAGAIRLYHKRHPDVVEEN